MHKMEIKQTEPFMMMGLNIRALIRVGLWPPNIQKYPILNYIYNIYAFLLLFIFAIFLTSLYSELYFVLDDLFELMFNLSLSLLNGIIAAKIIVLFKNRNKIAEILNKTRDFQLYVFNHPNKENRKVFVQYVNIVNFISKGFWVLAFITVNGLLLPGLVAVLGYSVRVKKDGTIIKTLPFSCYLPFDDQKYHTAAFIIQAIFCSSGTGYVALWDTFGFSLIMNGIGLLKVLQNSLITLGEYGNKSVYETTKDCVKFHQKIILYISELDSYFSTVLFMDFVVYAMLLCSIGVRVIFDENIDYAQMFAFLVYLGGVLVQLIMFYWTGNELMLESVNVAKAVYESNWYNFDRRVNKLLIIIMMRSQKPLKISVGRFYAMNLEALIIILKAWYSYLTCLNQIFNRKS